MSTWVSDQVGLFQQGLSGGQAVAGVAGAPGQPRGSEVRGLLKVYRFTIELATPNPVPGQPGGAVANNDTFIVAVLKPTDRVFSGTVVELSTWGAGVTLSFGKIDTNNASNTDAVHYMAAQSMAAAAGTIYTFTTNLGEQVGADPIGDQTSGQQLPQFGSGPIYVTATVGGATPNATGTLNGFIYITEEGN